MEGKTVPHKEVSTDQDRSSINKIPDSVNDAENNNGNGDHVTDSEKTVEKKTSVKNGIVASPPPTENRPTLQNSKKRRR